MSAHPPCRVEFLKPSHDAALVEAAGELDFYTSPVFQRCLMRAVEQRVSRVIVDLTQVSFMDSSALGALIGATRNFAQQAAELSVVCPPGNVARVIAISGFDRVFATYATRDEALGRTPRGQSA